MNVRIEPVHVMACVVKRETPPIWRWKLGEFQHGKSISASGIINIGWRGLVPSTQCYLFLVINQNLNSTFSRHCSPTLWDRLGQVRLGQVPSWA